MVQTITLTENLVGKVLWDSWGYDMTINDFFLVKRQTAHCVFAVPIGKVKQTGDGFAGHEVPDPAKVTGGEVKFLVRPVKYPNGEKYYFVGGGKCATLHDGKSVYYNTLD